MAFRVFIMLQTAKKGNKTTEESVSAYYSLPTLEKKHIKKVAPRFDLRSLDSKSRVLTITPWDHKCSEDIFSMLSWSSILSFHDYHLEYKHEFLKLQLSLARNFWPKFLTNPPIFGENS